MAKFSTCVMKHVATYIPLSACIKGNHNFNEGLWYAIKLYPEQLIIIINKQELLQTGGIICYIRN